MTTLLDTNVLINITKDDAALHAWAVEQLEACKALGPALITDIVYAEFSVAFPEKEQVDAVITALALERLPTSDNALFRAGEAFKLYRERQGAKSNVLPDFLIGAAAEEIGAPLITANPAEFRKYFPGISLIKP